MQSLILRADTALGRPACQPRPGNSSLVAAPKPFGGYTFHFVSESNLARFEADPVRFAPQTGGFCAFSLTGFDNNGAGFWCACARHEDGYAILNGSAYFFLFGGAKASFLKHGDAAIDGAALHWKELLQENGVDDLHCFNTARLTPVTDNGGIRGKVDGSSDQGGSSGDDPCDMMSCLAYLDCKDCPAAPLGSREATAAPFF